MLGDVNKLFVLKSLLKIPSNVLPLHLRHTFLPIIWIFTQGEEDDVESKLSSKKNSTLQNLPFVPEFEELLRFPSTFAFLASKQQIGVKRNNFSAARPWISGCLMVGLWLGKNAVWGIRCLKISQSITSSQFKPIKVSKKDKDTADN